MFHLRACVLDASCYSPRGRLKDVRYYVSVHFLMLRRDFEIISYATALDAVSRLAVHAFTFACD